MSRPTGYARFPKQRRLLQRRQYQRVFAKGRRSTDGPLVVFACRNALGFPRLGLAIARKHVRRAVQRNRLKRLIRESFRIHQRELGQLDLIVIARHGVDTMAAEDISLVLQRHWAKVRTRSAFG